MNNKVLLILAVLLTSTTMAFGDDVPYAKGRLLVRFAASGYELDSPTAQQRAQARQQILNQTGGGSVVRAYEKFGGWCLVELPQGTCVEAALEPYASTAGIVAVEPDYKIKLCRIPNDPEFGKLWAMRNIGQTGGEPGADVNAYNAWDYETGSADIVVAVTDTGIDYTHPDLQANMWINKKEQNGTLGVDDDGNGYIDDVYGYDFNDVDSNPMDYHGHGTHVAGTIGAVGYNSKGVAGVCWDVNLMALKIMGDDGGDNPVTFSSVAAEAIEYAVDNKADVINASWRVYDGWVTEPELIRDAVEYARSAGVLFVAAAGNESFDNDAFPALPASYDLDNIISVMATGHSDLKADYSNYGAVSVDIAAPGGDFARGGEPGMIYSTVPGAGYEFKEGTSMAAPHVAGACALVLSAQSSLTYSQVKELLMNTVDEKDLLAGRCVSGGRLNVFNAIKQIVVDTEAPQPDPAEWASWGRPKATGVHTIAMQAKEATDNKGSVQYFFKCVTDGAFSSSWQEEPFYNAEGLAAATTYTFRVRAQDDSNNMTDWSVAASAKTAPGPDDPCTPFPDPAQWSATPRPASTKYPHVVMVAKDASDESGPVEYRFEAYIDVGGNPDPAPELNRDWNANPVYFLTEGLEFGNKYYFKVRARDGDDANNMTDWSTLEAIDLGAQPQTIEVPSPDCPTIQDAIVAANNGDTIIIHRGTYPGKGFEYYDPATGLWGRGFVIDKNVTIRSEQPDDPECVANTVIDCLGIVEMSSGFILIGDPTDPNPNAQCRLRGLTIRDVYIYGGIRTDGVNPGDDGGSGDPMMGGGLIIDGSHLVENCVISECVLSSWSGGNGVDGNDTAPFYPLPGGNGGHGGDVGGAGIYIFRGSPVIRGTTINDCYAFAGNGGHGADGTDAPFPITDPNNAAGRGGNGGNAGAVFGVGVYIDHRATQPTLEDCTITNCYAYGGSAGDGGQGGDNADRSIIFNTPQPNGDTTGDGSGGHGGIPGPVLGAGIYCGSDAILKDCLIQRNFALAGYGGDGGNSGVRSPGGWVSPGGVGGLLDAKDPYLFELPYIPQFPYGPDEFTAKGGGVFVDANTVVMIENCRIADNVARGSVAGLGGVGNGGTLPVSPRQNYQIESYGSGVFCGSGSTDYIHYCEISRNRAIADYVDAVFPDLEDQNDKYPYGLHPHTERPNRYYPIDYFGQGGLYFDASLEVEITDSEIADNNVPIGGGMAVADVTKDFHLDNCQISDNIAKYGGGAVWTNSVIDANSCTISGNVATVSLSGGVHCRNSSLSLRNSEIFDNSSKVSGGGIYVIGAGSAGIGQEIVNCLIKDNQAGLDGGGIAARDNSFVAVQNCTIVDNSALSVAEGSGGGLSCVTIDSDASSLVEITSSIFWDNESTFGPQIAIGDPTKSNNPMATVLTYYNDIQGGEDDIFKGTSSGIGPWLYWAISNIDADPQFAYDSVNPLNAYYLSHLAAGQQVDSPCIDIGDPDIDLAADTGMVVTTRTDGVPDSCDVDMGYHYQATTVSDTYKLVIEVSTDAGFDPNGSLRAELFGDANLGESHNFKVEAREDINSVYVTRGAVVELTAIPDVDFKVREWKGTDNNNSTELTNTVTMDSHKLVSVSFAPDGYYYLVTDVNTANGRIDYMDDSLDEPEPHPGRTLHLPGEVVELIAVPDNLSHVTRWFGSDDDLTIARQNTVVMNDHRNVNVSFTAPRTLSVGADMDFPTIQLAIEDADPGDTVLITSGTYNIYEASEDEPYLYLSGKDIAITSDDPLNASSVTIIGGFIIENVRREAVIEGLTIQAEYSGAKLIGGPYKMADPEGSGTDGLRGLWGYGGGMWLVNGYMNEYLYVWPEDEELPKSKVTASPTVRNCVFRDCIVRGIHGGDGTGGADDEGYGGNGGPGGAALGGGVCIGNNAEPLFESCSFINCMAIGGDGGNAGDDPPGHGGSWGDKSSPRWWEYRVTDFWRYSGYGGAVYCGVNSSPEFINCSFTGNQSFGGSCGISGSPHVSGWPYSHYKIDRFGGAVYAADDSTPLFKDCVFSGNRADPNGPDTWNGGEADAISAYDVLSYGGAIAFEDANVIFEDCEFTLNTANVGGAIYYNSSDPYIEGCEIADNNALHGGGLLCVGGHGVIERCIFTGNMATINGAQGGAIASFGANTDIIDTQVIDNFSQTSGGGVYISNKDVSGDDLNDVSWNMISLHNCLIAENTAGSSGGGISANWHAFPGIENCTIANNTVGSAGYGGGLYSSYGNYATIKNSIFWGNTAGAGNQIALRPTERPSDVIISYSDIQGVLVPVRPPNINGGDIWADIGCNVTAVGGNIGSNPVAHNPDFVTGPLDGNYYLSQIVAGQIEDSPCVDAGDKTASAVKIANELTMDNYTTRTDWTQKSDAFDKGKVDMGFHFPFKHLMDECRVCNLHFDETIDTTDLHEFSLRWSWLGEHCSEDNDYCNGGDFNFDHKVDFSDFALLAGCWLTTDRTPPMPSPMQWDVRPYSTSSVAPYGVSMRAVQAFDSWGWPTPQYRFECTSDPNWSSSWQDSREYAPTGLEPDTGYIFRVRARDDMDNKTRWSDEVPVITGKEQHADDNTAPIPNPMTWFEVPFAMSDTEIDMVASTAADESDVEYGFWNVTLDPGGTQVIWQDEPNFIDTGLAPETSYAYRCAARDKSFNRNMTEWSDMAVATTLPAGTEPDLDPPVTGVHADIYKAAFEDDSPSEVYVSGDGYYHTMTAATATDATEPVWYMFICDNESGFNSDWQQEATYSVLVARLNSKDYYRWQVITRDSVVPTPNVGNLSDYHNCKGDVFPYP